MLHNVTTLIITSIQYCRRRKNKTRHNWRREIFWGCNEWNRLDWTACDHSLPNTHVKNHKILVSLNWHVLQLFRNSSKSLCSRSVRLHFTKHSLILKVESFLVSCETLQSPQRNHTLEFCYAASAVFDLQRLHDKNRVRNNNENNDLHKRNKKIHKNSTPLWNQVKGKK